MNSIGYFPQNLPADNFYNSHQNSLQTIFTSISPKISLQTISVIPTKFPCRQFLQVFPPKSPCRQFLQILPNLPADNFYNFLGENFKCCPLSAFDVSPKSPEQLFCHSYTDSSVYHERKIPNLHIQLSSTIPLQNISNISLKSQSSLPLTKAHCSKSQYLVAILTACNQHASDYLQK